MKIKISDLEIRNEWNVRDSLSQAKIVEYAESFDALPPVVVFKICGKFCLVDGFHRVQAARGLGLAEVACSVREGSELEARVAACLANLGHGLALSDAEKRTACLRLGELRPDLGAEELAELMGVHRSTVFRWRQKVASATEASASAGNRAATTGVESVRTVFDRFLRQIVDRHPVARWSDEEKAHVRLELAPIVEFYASLEDS